MQAIDPHMRKVMRRSGSVLARAALAAAGGAILLGSSPVHAQAATKAFESSQFRYSVALPSGCRHEEGPGTLDAVCSTELDPEKSAQASAAASLVLEVGAEAVPDDAGKPASALAQSYGEDQFKQELPEAICGEPDRSRVKIDNVKQVLDDSRVVYTADIACPEIKFLGLNERRARVSFMITPGLRYRLMARAQKDEFEERKEPIDAFFASFRVLPADK
jgi:hypothetical protein